MSRILSFYIFSSVLFLFLCFSSCNTGIESTKTIKMTKSDKKSIQPTDEEYLAEQFISPSYEQWKIGKEFLIADDKAFLILKGDSKDHNDLVGSVLTYQGVVINPSAGGEDVGTLRFKSLKNNKYYDYNTGRDLKKSKNISGLDIPALIDLDLINLVDSLIGGREFWIKSNLWYDDKDNPLQGRKYVPVKIIKVLPGNIFFPIKIIFMDEETKNIANLYMNIKGSTGLGAESRTFPSLFFIQDPRLNYTSIPDETWRLIQNGKVKLGMTKEECRLSLGNPPDVDSGHDWNNTIDIWRYKDGTFLRFQDGLLIDYRHL